MLPPRAHCAEMLPSLGLSFYTYYLLAGILSPRVRICLRCRQYGGKLTLPIQLGAVAALRALPASLDSRVYTLVDMALQQRNLIVTKKPSIVTSCVQHFLTTHANSTTLNLIRPL